MARNRTTKQPNPFEQIALGKTAPDRQSASVSKAEAVRRAVAAGKDNPTEGVAYVFEHFGIEMDNKTFSLNKAQQKAREAKRAEVHGQTHVEAGKPIEGFLAPPKIELKGEGDLIEVMETMKPMIAQFGADKIKRIVDLLG